MKRDRDIFTGRMFRGLFFPSLCASLGLAFSDMADALVVGNSMGEVGLAAIGMTLPVFMVLNLFMHGFGIGGSVRYAQLMGAGREEEAVLSFNRVLQWALGVSLWIALSVNLFPAAVLRLLGADRGDAALYSQTMIYVRVIAGGAPLFFLNFILGYYLRCDDRQRRASAGMLVSTAVDIGLNILLVMVLKMGILGAALATLAGSAGAVLVYLPALADARHSMRVRWVRPSAREALSCFKTGVSSSIQYAYQMAFLLIANHTLLRIAGGSGVAIFDMVQNASYLIMYLYDAAGKALQPLASTFYGEKNRSAVRKSLRLALGWALGCGTLAAALVCIFPGWVCRAFGMTDAALLVSGARALRIYCLSGAFAGVSVLLETYCQCVQRERDAFVIATLRGCAVLLPVTLLISALVPDGFWWVYPIVEIGSLLLFALWNRFWGVRAEELPKERVFYALIRNRREDLAGLCQQIEDFCSQWAATPRQQYFVGMAVEEISVAIMENAFDRIRDGYIQITLIACLNGEFELHIRDNASVFNPFSLQTEKMGSGDVDMGAMGMLVIKQRAKSFYYRQYQGFNTLVVKI